MTITFEDEYGRDWPFSPEELAVQVAEACLDYENCPYEAQVNILLTGNEEIRQMNRQFRNIDRETDVLSFPMGEYPAPGDFSAIEEDADSFDPETGELLLGDIVLSGDRILSQAQEYGHSVRRGICLPDRAQYAASDGLRPYRARRSRDDGKQTEENPGSA